VAPRSASAQRSSTGTATPLEKALTEYAIGPEQFESLIGKRVTILLNTGKQVDQCTVDSFGQGRDKTVFRTISVRRNENSKVRRYAGGLLFRLEIDGRRYRVTQVPSKRAFALIDVVAQTRTIVNRLAQRRHRMWPSFSEQQQQEHLTELRQFLREVAIFFAPLRMQLHETNYFLFLTDMPPNQIAPYLRHLDAMNEQLGQAFGFEPGANVWYGKATIVAFLNRESFVEFEREFMNNENTGGAQGLCHQSNSGRVVVGCYRGNNPSFFASLLVHETAHGYVHRYKSTVPIPSWLNEGIADWIADVTVPNCDEVQKRQKRAADRLRQFGTFGGQFFDARKIPGDLYGSASACVNLMMRESPVGFRVCVDGIKEGFSWQESLQRAFGLSPNGLAAAYGQSIGIAVLTP
jgi:hypothetical protein